MHTTQQCGIFTYKLYPNFNQYSPKELIREARFQVIGPESGNLEREAVKAYRAALGLRPNQAQRASYFGSFQAPVRELHPQCAGS